MKIPDIAIENSVVRALAAVVSALVLACLIFLVFGILIPALGFRAHYGTGDEADGPGITAMLLPMAVGVICVAAGCALTKVFYQSWSPSRPDRSGRW